MKNKMKRTFIAACKSIAVSDLNWLIQSHNSPNGFESAWSKRVVAAILRRHGVYHA